MSVSLLTLNVDVLSTIFKWTTIALVALALVLALVLFFVHKTGLKRFGKIALIFFAVYFVLAGTTLFLLDAMHHYGADYAEENALHRSDLLTLLFLPVCGMLLACVGSMAGYAVAVRYKPSIKTVLRTVLLVLCLVAVTATLICIGIYYQKHVADDGYYNSTTASVKQFALYLSSALLVLLLFVLGSLEKEPLQTNAKSLAYAGVCVAMSFALSYCKLWDMPTGGSVTLASLLPLALYAYAFGLKKGLFTAFAYSLLQALQDPWLIHPAQFFLDYPVAFTAVGLAGIFKVITKLPDRVAFGLGTAFVGVLRYVAHLLSGVFAFEAYAGGQNAFVYSAVYNLYVFADIAIVVVLGVVVLSSKAFSSVLKRAATY